MLEPFFFVLGLVNSILLILIFLIRKNRLGFLQRFGWLYLFLAIPAAYGVFLVFQERKAAQYGILLGISLAYLAAEGIYDFALKVPFRETRNWRLLVPYLGLYYAMNYGFVVMVWKTSLTGGLIMLGLFVIQVVANPRTHSRNTIRKSS